jgi:putative ABC transport system permease protein
VPERVILARLRRRADMAKGTTGTATPYIPAAGWLAVIGGTILLSIAGTLLPARRVLRIPPIEAIALPE